MSDAWKDVVKMLYGFFVTGCLAAMIMRVMFGHATVDAAEEKVLTPLILVFTLLAKDWASWAFEKVGTAVLNNSLIPKGGDNAGSVNISKEAGSNPS